MPHWILAPVWMSWLLACVGLSSTMPCTTDLLPTLSSALQLFETVDLYEEKDLGVVVNCILALARVIRTAVPSYTGPVPELGHVSLLPSFHDMPDCQRP